MYAPRSLVPVTAAGPVSAATVAWRARGALYLTVIVKATFALVPEGRMSPAEPDPIASGERPDPSGVGLRTAGDLAPYLGQPEVWLTGHVAVPPRFSQPSLHVQFAVVREGAVCVDKQLALDVSGASADPRTVGIAGMGPIAEGWPLRSRWLEGIDQRGLQGPVLDLPDALHWEYFQTSPLDQRLGALRGDEWLVLGGMVAGRPRLRTQLPAAWGAARLYRREHPAPRAGEAVPLRADTVQVEVDRLRCSILWRGRVQLGGEAELGSLRVVAGLEQPGQSAAWADPFPPPPIHHAPAKAPEVSETPFAGTVGLSDDVARRLAAALATPFEKPREPVAEAIPFSGTSALPDDLGRMLAAAPLTPFREQRGSPAPRFESSAPTGVSPQSVLSTGTLAMSDDMSARLAAALATPFERDAEAAPEETPFAGTLALPDDLSERLGAAEATPFEVRARGAMELPIAATDDVEPVGIPAWPVEEAVAPVVAAPPALFAEAARPEVSIAPQEAGVEPGGLGAEFLALMADAGEAG
jgi:hypothetical protein